MKKVNLLLGAWFFCLGTLSAQFEWAGYGEQMLQYTYTGSKSHIIVRDSFFSVVDNSGYYKYGWEYINPDIYESKCLDVLEFYDSSYLYLYKFYGVFLTEFYFWDKYNHNWNFPPLSYGDVIPEYWCENQLKAIEFDSSHHLIYRNGNDCPAIIVMFNHVNVQNGWWYRQYDGYELIDGAAQNGQAIFCTNNGLIVLDKQGNITDQYDGYYFDRIKNYDDTSLLVLRADTLVRITSKGELLDTLIITDGQILDFDARNGKIGVLTSTMQYYIFNDQMEETGYFYVDNPVLDCTHTQLGDTSVFLAGHYHAGQLPYNNDYVFVKEYSFDGIDNAPKKDIGVVGITHGAVTVTQYPSYFQVLVPNVVVDIQNFGTTPIDYRLALSTGSHFPAVGGDFTKISFQQWRDQGPLLEPGATLKFYWNELYLEFKEDPRGKSFNLCMWSSLPNEGLDINPANDVGCVDFLVDIREVVASVNPAIFPNPAREEVNIEMPEPLAQPAIWTLYNITGQQVRQHQLVAGQSNHRISLADILPGLYVWEARSAEERLGSGKLVVME